MTLVLTSIRKVAVISWNVAAGGETASTWHIGGAGASIEVTLHDGTVEEVRTVPNHGTADLFFPMDYTGEITVIVKGSSHGEDEAKLAIT